MSLATRDVARYLAGDSLPVFSTTARNLAAVIAPLAESGIVNPATGQKVPGVPLGDCGRDRSGGKFYFDEHQLYQAGIVQDTNGKVFGKVGNWKSSLMKRLIFRSTAFGLRNLATDMKGEYSSLVQAVGGAKELRFGNDANLYINPLDNVLDIASQEQLLELIGLTALGSNASGLNIKMKSILWSALADTHVAIERGNPLLSDLVERLFEPTPRMVDEMQRSKDYIRDEAYDLALAFRRLTTGNLRSMFHEQTTPGLFDPTPLLVLNCEGLHGQAVIIMIHLINFFTESKVISNNPDRRFHRVIHDESWDLALQPGFVESVRRGFKLGGTRGTSYWIVAHHWSNLTRSATSEAVKDLSADSSFTFFFKEDEDELRQSAQELELTEAEIQRIVNYKPGECLVKIGKFGSFELKDDAWPEEMAFLETRHRLKGKDESGSPLDSERK